MLEFGEHANTEQPSHFTGSAAKTDGALKVLDAVNAENDTNYTPKLRTAPDRADTYAGKGERPLRVLALGMSFIPWSSRHLANTVCRWWRRARVFIPDAPQKGDGISRPQQAAM